MDLQFIVCGEGEAVSSEIVAKLRGTASGKVTVG